MLIRLLPWQAALRGPHEDALRLRADGSIGEADLIDTTLAWAFCALSGAVTEDWVWVRALRVLLDVGAYHLQS